MGNQKTDFEIEAGSWQEKLAGLQKVATKSRKIWLAGGAMIGIGFSMAAGGNASGLIAALLGLIVFLIGWSRFMKADKAMKGLATETIISDMVGEVFDDVDCHVDEMIPAEVLKRYAPVSMDKIVRQEGNNHIQAVYRDHKVEMGNVKLYGELNGNSDGAGGNKESSNEKPVFHGFCILCNLGRNFGEEILVREKNLEGQPFAKSKVGAISERFAKQFDVEAENMEDANKILTDPVKKHLITINEYTYGKLCFRLFKDGGVAVGINNGRDGFDLSILKKANAADLQKKFQMEALLYSAIVDVLIEIGKTNSELTE